MRIACSQRFPEYLYLAIPLCASPVLLRNEKRDACKYQIPDTSKVLAIIDLPSASPRRQAMPFVPFCSVGLRPADIQIGHEYCFIVECLNPDLCGYSHLL